MLKTLLTIAALGPCALTAQAPNATAGLIRLNVVAVNDAGEPVLDLNSSDFQIADQGKSQKIVFFRPNPSAAPAPQLAPHEYSNRTEPSPHSTVILFDLLNVTEPDRMDTWHKLGQSLQQLPAGDSLYFYLLTLEGNLEPIHALGGKTGDDHTWTQHVEENLDKAMKVASHARPTQMNDQELVVKKTYVALETLANQMTATPGRRDILWITGGMPIAVNDKIRCTGDWVDCALYVPHMAVTLAFDNVAVSPVMYTSNPNPDMTRDLEQMALLTGGSTYTAEDIRSVIKQVSRDASTSYAIAYDLPSDALDAKFHKIRITVRRKGIKIRSKQRYFAYPDKTPEATKQHALLATDYESPVDDPAIGLRAIVKPGEAGKPAHLDIHVNPADLLIPEKGGHDTLTILIADLGAGGPMGEPTMSNINVDLSPEQRTAAAKDGIPISQDHAINDSIQKLRIIVLDQNADTVGSLTIPLKQ